MNEERSLTIPTKALITFRPRFHRRFPDLMANVDRNRHRLVTHFDTHKTLLHLLHLQTNSTHPWSNKVDSLMPTSFSVLTDEIPVDRTCNDAGIAPEFCSCDLIHHVAVDSRSEKAMNIANIFVQRINEFLKPALHVCQVVSLDRIVSVTKDSKLSRVYAITARMRPRGFYQALVEFPYGGAEARLNFSGINRLDSYKGEFHVLGG